MKKLSLFIPIVFLMSLFFSNIYANTRGSVRIKAQVRNGSTKMIQLYEGSHALLIGASKYTAGWPKLGCVPDEIARIEIALKNQGFKVKKVMDPTGQELEAAFKDFIDKYGYDEKNRLLFFFSGHGYSRKGGKKGYLVPVDAPDPRDNEKSFMRKSLGMNQVLTWSKKIESKHALFLFDSCFSGTIFKAKALPKHPPHISNVTSRPVRQFISAGSAGEEVPARSVFTPSFIRALGGEGDLDKDGYVTGTEMGMYLHRKVLSYETGQTPQYGKIKDPDLDEGDFVFQLASSSGMIEDVPSKNSTLSVEANVSGAVVFLDGRKIGKTDIDDVSVSPGKHRIRVEKKGYETYQKSFELKSGRDKSLYVILEKEDSTGSLYVNTEPADAKVRILDIGLKFYQGIDLEAGSYQVEVSASGYEKKELRVTIKAGKDKEVDVRLKKQKTRYQSGKGEKRVTVNGVSFNMVNIRSGSFMMGSPSSESNRGRDEGPQHRVQISAFQMGATEVTQGLWRAVMGNNPSKFSGNNNPVEQVSWEDAQDFIRKLNSMVSGGGFRLPTEAEWEYACRAGSSTPFSFGNCLSTGQANYDGNYPYSGCSKGTYRKKTIPVKSFSPNSWGLYDMHGNVWEWCEDIYSADTYRNHQTNNPVYTGNGSDRVNRGGSWYHNARNCRSALRFSHSPGNRDAYLGFRLARTP